MAVLVKNSEYLSAYQNNIKISKTVLTAYTSFSAVTVRKGVVTFEVEVPAPVVDPFETLFPLLLHIVLLTTVVVVNSLAQDSRFL